MLNSIYNFLIGFNMRNFLLRFVKQAISASCCPTLIGLICLLLLLVPAHPQAQPISCNSPLNNLAPGLGIVINQSPSAADIDAISDANVVSGIGASMQTLLMSQSGTYSLFNSWNAACPTYSQSYQFAQNVGAKLSGSDPGNLNTLAILTVGSAIANSTSFGFNATVNGAAISSQLSALATQAFIDRIATAIYDVNMLQATGPNNTYFRAIIGNATLGQAYQAYVSAAPYINQLVTEIQTSQPNATHKALLVTYKLQKMNQAAYSAVATLYAQNNLPVYAGVWNDLYSAAQFQESPLLSQVTQQINQATSTSRLQGVGYGAFINYVTTTYGAGVQSFVSGPLGGLGLATGTAPNNVSRCTGVAGTQQC